MRTDQLKQLISNNFKTVKHVFEFITKSKIHKPKSVHDWGTFLKTLKGG